MPVLVDANVIADVLHGDPLWADCSHAQRPRHAGDLPINPMIHVGLCCCTPSPDEVEQVITSLGMQYSALPRAALFIAAQAYQASGPIACAAAQRARRCLISSSARMPSPPNCRC